MTVFTTFERKTFGKPLTPAERVITGVVAGVGAVGNIALGAVAVLFLYGVVTTGL